MNRNEHLLTIVAEECAEVAQRCTKSLRFGMGERQVGQNLTNSDRLLQEFNDLLAGMEMVYGKPLADLINWDQMAKKKAQVEKYLEYSKQCGTLNHEESDTNNSSPQQGHRENDLP